MRSRSVPTLLDVATEANVSTATVSRSLNNPDAVVPRTRKRVLEAVSKLGYSPNFGARALAARRTNTIGAVIPTMENAIFARGLQAFQETLSLGGCTLLVASSSYRPDVEEEQIRSLVARGADGLLLIGTHRSQKIYDFLTGRDIPYVVAWTYRPDADHTYVGFDNRGAAIQMVHKVLALGHRRIGMIAGLTAGNDRARDRRSGVEEAIATCDHPAASLSVAEAEYSYDAGGDAAERLMDGAERPTVLICGNDILAVGAIKRLKKLGLQVPQQVSVTGFDDIEVATIVEPSLTTVHVPHRDMGGIAAKTLLRMISGDAAKRTDVSTGKSHQLMPDIVDRESLVAP